MPVLYPEYGLPKRAGGNNNSMDEYESKSIDMAMRNYKPMTHEQVIIAARKMRSGDDALASRARAQLMAANYAMCADISIKWYRAWNKRMRHSGLDDVFQASVLGLMRAVDKYDPESGFRLTTYSYNWITSFVQRFCYDNSGSYRVPCDKWGAKTRKQEDEDAIELACSFSSIDKPVNQSDSDGLPLSELIIDDNSSTYHDVITSASDEEFWSCASTSCTDYEMKLMRMRADGLSLEEISKSENMPINVIFGIVERGTLKAIGHSSALF